MERTGTTEVPLTQEQLAAMLGVGRSYISRVLGSFKNRGVIATRRGALVVNDLQQLKSLACVCNECVRRHFDDVLRGVYPTEDIVAR
jgi:DNA-binding FadR family transcriptional regulator